MKFSIHQQAATDYTGDCLILPVYRLQTDDSDTANQQSALFQQLDQASNGTLGRLLHSGDISSKTGQTTWLYSLAGMHQKLLLVGCGKPADFTAVVFRRICLAAATALRESHSTKALCALTDSAHLSASADWQLRIAALEFSHANYRYTHTKKPADDAAPAISAVAFASQADSAQLDQALAIGYGVDVARNLGDLPPNICHPLFLAEHARQLADDCSAVEVEVLDVEAMQALHMNALLAVGVGSHVPPRLIALHYRGAAAEAQPYVLVGKGITFDTGGISIKPGANMEQMKYDMCGAATVLGAFFAAVKLQLPLNISCVVAAAENMPDGRAYRPGDVITSMSGKTIEVLNTDAEGRMVLCDALTWSQRLQPAAIVDVATLTGACVVALGHHASAVMSKHDDLVTELLAAGQSSLDRCWQLPLWDEYQKQLDTKFADMKNVGGMPAGSITAGCFLSRFTEGQRWAHLDIAGAAWEWGKNDGATGRPVRLLTQWLMDRAAS
ncbi:MAG: leucyl aminopeptidase [Gammaproteobacteria bacterium]|jgi:leucyl aminopeptidase|nr:leucyl aminopeptidase [Gammaproteobacteria bacterium]